MGSYTDLAGQDPHSQCYGMEYDLENNLQKPVNGSITSTLSQQTSSLRQKVLRLAMIALGSGTGADCSLKEEFESIL